MTINLLHLYYDIMNLYGEYGNIKLLKKHIEDQGYEVNIDRKTISDDIDFSKYDFIYIGSGTEKNEDVVLDDLRKYKDDLKDYIESGKYILMTGNSYEMLGVKIEDKQALEILNFETVRLKDRVTSDIIYRSKYFKNKIVGFVNRESNIYHNMNPLFEVEFGIGENEKKDNEGIKYNNLYGTYIIGPILARNPEVLKFFVDGICKMRDANYKGKNISYENEEKSYNIVLSELEKRN